MDDDADEEEEDVEDDEALLVVENEIVFDDDVENLAPILGKMAWFRESLGRENEAEA